MWWLESVVRPGDGHVQLSDRVHGARRSLQPGNTCRLRQLGVRRLRQHRRLSPRLQGSIFSAHLSTLLRAIAKSHLSVRPSVRLSVTLANHAYTVSDIEIFFSPTVFLVFWSPDL